MDKKGYIADLLWIFHVTYALGSEVKPHAHHHHYHLIYALEGSCCFDIEGNSCEFSKGMCAFVSPEDIHSIKTVYTKQLQTYEIKFLLPDTGIKRALRNVPPFFNASQFVRNIIEAILEAASHPNSIPDRQACQYYLGSLLLNVAQPHFETAYGISRVGNVSQYFGGKDISEFTSATHSIIKFLKKNYKYNISLDQISEAICYNKSYMCLAFKNDTGKTISNFLNFIRIRNAANLIVYSDLDLMQISEKTGFNSICHFNRTFKKLIGMPPGQYRQSFPEKAIIEDLSNTGLDSQNLPRFSNTILIDFNHKNSRTINSSIKSNI